MPRLHSGGFINPEFYFNIGTEPARGRDGDTARVAAKKYNDHRHSPYAAPSPSALRNWINEFIAESEEPLSSNPGGFIEAAAGYIRLPGDTAELNSIIYAVTSQGIKPVTSGFGPHISLPADATQDPDIIEDYVSSNYTMMRRPTPLGGYQCVMGNDGNNPNALVPAPMTVGDCVVYPTTRAGSGTIYTQVGVAASVLVTSAPEVNNRRLEIMPRIGILLSVKRFNYDPITARIRSTVSSSGDTTLITSLTGQTWPNDIANGADEGFTVADLINLDGNFVGKFELEMQFDLEGCYTPDDFIAEANEHQISVSELKSKIADWAQNNVSLNLLDATARVLCTFGGE